MNVTEFNQIEVSATVTGVVGILSFDVHVQSNSIGSSAEYVK